MHRSRFLFRFVVLTVLLCAVGATSAEGAAAAAEQIGAFQDDVELLAAELEASITLKQESEEEISIDAEGSMDVPEKLEGRRGWSFQNDIRGLMAANSLDSTDGSNSGSSDIEFRIRGGASRSFTDSIRGGLRFAASCTSEACKPDGWFDEGIVGDSDQSIDIDEAFVHWYRSERFDIVFGRLQTRFITKGGVFAKSLDRNDSNGTRITWTDGAHGTLQHNNGWESHLIVQHNPKEGPAQVLREPLNFRSSGSRTSSFLSLTNEQPVRFLTQRALDISYFPSALNKDGLTAEGRIEDYWGVVGRIAGRYPKRSSGRRLRFSAELGYAPETPTKEAVNLPGNGDTNGFAAAITLSLIDLLPKQSLGLNFAHTGAGWLLSPQYNKNEQLLELRYIWVVSSSLTLDARLRHREELDQQIGAVQRRRELDSFIRLTWRLRRDLPALFP